MPVIDNVAIESGGCVIVFESFSSKIQIITINKQLIRQWSVQLCVSIISILIWCICRCVCVCEVLNHYWGPLRLEEE